MRKRIRVSLALAAITLLTLVGIVVAGGIIGERSQQRGETVLSSGEPDVEIPTVISYQGLLTDSDSGEPISGTVSMAFSLYISPTGGIPVWSETHPSVSLDDGLFNLLLGRTVPITTGVLGGESYLGVQVGSEAEMTPRQQIVSAPYALVSEEANNANAVDGIDSSGFASGNDLDALEARVSILEGQPVHSEPLAATVDAKTAVKQIRR